MSNVLQTENRVRTSLSRAAEVNILVIDDNTEHLRLLSDLLTRSGYQVRPTRSGSAGLRAARMIPPDLILLDVKLPGEDGFAVCRALKADSDLVEIPVIFISGLDDRDSQAKGFQSGGQDYITKPFDEVVVLARIRNQIQIQYLQREQKAYAQQLERQRIARDLHDSVNQTLFMLGSTVQTLLLTENNLAPALADQLNYVHQLSQTAIDELRMLLYELRPEMLQHTSLIRLIQHRAQSLQLRTNAELAVIAPDDHAQFEPDVELKVTIFRIAQEALLNAVRHASAKHILVQFVGDARERGLCIEDDGIGFVESAASPTGMGITNMRERAAMAGISIGIETAPDAGTRITIHW